MLKQIRDNILKVNISGRVMLFFSVLLLVSLTVSGIIFQNIYSDMMTEQIKESSAQTIKSINTSIKATLKNVNNSSMVLLSDPSIQRLLREPDSSKDLKLVSSVNRTISSMMGNYNEIYSIYLIDRKGNKYYSDLSPRNFLFFNSEFYSNSWREVRELNGASKYIKNGGDIFSEITTGTFVSNIRAINDLKTQKPIGGLLINVSLKALQNSYKEITERHNTKIFIFDEKSSIITSSTKFNQEVLKFLISAQRDSLNFKINNKNGLIYTYSNIEDYNWSVVSVMPIAGGKHITSLMLAFIITFIILALLVFLGSAVIAKTITKPINILVDSMSHMSEGHLKKVEFDTTIKEFNRLRDGYNSMSDEIHSLISRTISQEKTKRKAELNTLQAQIKPHFLYNTFDSISSLALMGKNQDVHQMVSSLGNFYRISLSKGREIIPLTKELEALKSYLNILKLRYNNFKVIFEIDETENDTNILKLILQPFVENAIYHGIKPKGEDGYIRVATSESTDFLTITIEDNGVGMSNKDVENLYDNKESFGVRGTIKRIGLHYGVEGLVKIDSQLGHGTVVTIKIPKGEVL